MPKRKAAWDTPCREPVAGRRGNPPERDSLEPFARNAGEAACGHNIVTRREPACPGDLVPTRDRREPDSGGPKASEALFAAITGRNAVVAVIGLGYVGLPLLCAFHRAGFPTLGLDTDPAKIELLRAGNSYITDVPDSAVAEMAVSARSRFETDFGSLGNADAIAIAVPTPLGPNREPDLRFVEASTRSVAATLRPHQFVALESTTYPGTTEHVVRPILEATGLRSGKDFFLAYAPERENPGERTPASPRVVGADGDAALRLAVALYGAVSPSVHPVSGPATAEAVKLTENVFRAVNIALVNELKGVYAAMGIDIWEVVEAAATKPFGYMPFHPGPGWGGHCIPIDPFYLAWAARASGTAARFVELAGEINAEMPARVVARLADALDRLDGKRILLVGLAYKRNVNDTRESPALRLWQALAAAGAEVAYHDPHVPAVPETRAFPHLAGTPGVVLDREVLGGFDAALIATDHKAIDWEILADALPLIVDTRNVYDARPRRARIIKA